MEQFVESLVINNILVVFALIAVLQAIKKIGVPTKYIDLIAICIGALFTILLQGVGIEAVLNGFVIGLASCKLYDKILDTAFKKFEKEEKPLE